MIFILFLAIAAMKKMSENHDKLQNTDGLTIHDIICLAAQLALEVRLNIKNLIHLQQYFTAIMDANEFCY